MAFSAPSPPAALHWFQSPWRLGALTLLLLALAWGFPLWQQAVYQHALALHSTLPTLAPFTQWPFVLGTDDLGRDLLSRLWIGGQLSLGLGGTAGTLAVLIGGTYGLVAALAPQKINDALMKGVDILYSLPNLMLVILGTVFLEPWLQGVLLKVVGQPVAAMLWAKSLGLILALALFGWTDTARLIRTQVQQLQQEPFSEAYWSLGGGLWRYVQHHVLPNVWPHLLLCWALTVPRAVIAESTLSFVGLGLDAPLSSWGTLASEGWVLLGVAPHVLLSAACCILASLLGFHALTERLKNRTT